MNSAVLKIKLVNTKNCFATVPSRFVSQVSGNHVVHLLSAQNTESLPIFVTCVPQPKQGSYPPDSSCDKIIEIPRHFAELNGFRENEDISVLYNAGKCPVVLETAHVRPLSASDWDILELNASLVQSSLLNQIQVVWPGAKIPVWINANTHVDIVIESVTPNCNFGLLAPLSELVVAPVSRSTETAPPLSPGGNSRKAGLSESKSELTSRENVSTLSIWSQFKQFIHPNQTHLSPLLEESQRKTSKSDALVKASMSPFSPPRLFQSCQPLKLRVHPITPKMCDHIADVLLKRYSCGIQPYMAFVTRSCLDFSAPDIAPGQNHILAKLIGKNVADTRGDSIFQCVVHVLALDTFPALNVEDFDGLGIPDHAVLLTDSSRRQLHLQIGERVQICFGDSTPVSELRKIVLYPLEKTVEETKPVDNEFKRWVTMTASEDFPLLLNNNQHITVHSRKVESNQVRSYAVSLFPDVECALLGPGQLSSVSVDMKPFVDCKDLPENIRLRLPTKETLVSEQQQEKLSGFDKLLKDGQRALIKALALDCNPVLRAMGGCRHGNVLVTGQKGSGKTSLLKSLCKWFAGPPHFVQYNYISCSAIAGKKPETLRQEWVQTFIQGLERQPFLLVLDDLELLCPSITEGDTGNEAIYSSKIADLILELVRKLPLINQVVILAACTSPKLLNTKLYRDEGQHFIMHEVTIPSPDKSARLEMLQAFIEGKDIESDVANWGFVLRKTEGCTVSDLHNLVQRALQFVKASSIGEPEGHIVLKERHLDKALEDFLPFALMGVTLKPASQDQKLWKDIGGLSHAKKSLITTFQWPTQFPELFESLPIKLKSGMLLYGPPGTGKTLLASAVASECGTSFISVKGPELLSKYIGASEEAVRQTFQRARAAKPCILFFDEFESLAPRRGHDSTGVTDRVVNQLLTELDGVQGPNKGLWVLAATSRPDLIDPALLRPGRFDVLLHCPLPDYGERLEILQLLSQKTRLSPEVRLDEIASLTEHYSGADLQGLLYTAQLLAINNARTKDGGLNQTLNFVVDQATLLKAVTETQPSVSDVERHEYARIFETFRSSRTKSTLNVPTKVLATLA